MVTEGLIQQMNIYATDFPAEIDELEMAGLTTAPSSVVKVPRIAQAHAALECREFTTMEIGRSRIILGRVVAMYVEIRFIDPPEDGRGPYIKAEELHAVGRNERPGQLRPHPRQLPHRPAHLIRGVAERQALAMEAGIDRRRQKRNAGILPLPLRLRSGLGSE